MAITTPAELVRHTYIICYRAASGQEQYGMAGLPKWDGGEDSFGARHARSVWPNLAEFIANLDANPLEYIQSQFSSARGGRWPTPVELMNDRALGIWEQYRYFAEDQLSRQLASEHNIFNVNVCTLTQGLRWDNRRAARYCLNSQDMVNLSPLYRYCQSRCYGFEESAASFHDRALLQYLFQKTAYDRRWGDFIPHDLRTAATTLRRDLPQTTFVPRSTDFYRRERDVQLD